MDLTTFAKFANQHSYLLTAAALLGGATAIARRLGGLSWALVPLVAGGLLAAHLVLKTGSSPYRSASAVQATLVMGRPTLVEFYSDY